MVPKGTKKDWVTDELRNLSTKKRDAWLRVQNAQTPQDQEQLMAEYQTVRQLTKAAAERARNSKGKKKRARWSSQTVEAERQAQTAERSGRGGSLVKELRFLESSFQKASTAPLLSSDKTPLTNDEDKLQRWSEHFSSVVNCCSTVSQLTLESLPMVTPSSESQLPLSGDDDTPMCAPLTEDRGDWHSPVSD